MQGPCAEHVAQIATIGKPSRSDFTSRRSECGNVSFGMLQEWLVKAPTISSRGDANPLAIPSTMIWAKSMRCTVRLPWLPGGLRSG